MFTQTKRPATKEEIAPYRLKLEKAALDLARADKSEKGRVPVLGIACLVLALLFLAGCIIVNVGLLTLSSVLFVITFSLLIITLSTRPVVMSEYLKVRKTDLEELVKSGEFVESRVLSSRCFGIDPFDEEGPDYYFDLGEEGTMLICESEMPKGWTPNTDMTLSYLESPSTKRFGMRVRNVGQRLEPIEWISREDDPGSDENVVLFIPDSFENQLEKMQDKWKD
jgi:hypothetical protein